jgi:hypothetical protein
MQDGFSYCHSIKSFENSFWIFLPDSTITVDVKHRLPQRRFSVIVAGHQILRHRRAEKDLSHTQEPIAWIGNVRIK